jgi:hypothetical protein
MAQSKKPPASVGRPTVYLEDVRDAPQQPPQSSAQYDDEGPSGVFRSPYVLGAALLASLGGFSFGYGTSYVGYTWGSTADLC